jgi:preprotein translocase subunit SecG
MHAILLGLHILVAIALIALVLLQHGKGADVGAAFGSGASGTVFGARGSASFLSRVTAVLAALFFAISMSLAYLGTQVVDRGSVVERVQAAEEGQAPKTPEQPATETPERPPKEAPPADVPSLPPE